MINFVCLDDNFIFMRTIKELTDISTQVRRDIVRMVGMAKSGHPGGSLSSADIMTALFFEVMEHNPQTWNRSGSGQDVFILSAGHITPVYYSVLARTGYFLVSELASLRKLGTRLQGHPSVEFGLPGIYQTSGSLGQGISVGAGMAMAKRLDGDDKFVYVLCGDGECEEGQIWEAAMFAPHHKIDNLIAMTDVNGQQIDGTIEAVAGFTELEAKWKAFGWNVICADGHDFESIFDAFAKAKANRGSGKPTMILFATEMGHGVDFMAGTNEYHGKAPSAEQVEIALSQLEETLGDF